MATVNILVVEDESIVALDIQSRLQKMGYAVPALASTGAEAIASVEKSQPDIVLMDIKLRGDLDGIQTAEKIRGKFDIPVIYLTAYADDLTLQRAKTTESFGYLLKPFEERELAATIETALYKHTMERKLKENEQWLSTTLKSIGDAVIATDIDGRIKFMNPVAEKLTGWPQNEALNKHAEEIYVIVDEATQKPLENPIQQVLQQDQPLKLSRRTLLVSRAGPRTPVDESGAPIKDDKNYTRGVVLVFRDITEQRQTEATLREYTAQLQARNEELDAFAHTVAHDLQSPLGHIVSMADAVKTYHSTMSASELERYLDILVQSGLKTSNIIDALLLLAGVRRKETVETQPLDMKKIVAEAQQRLAHILTDHNGIIHTPENWPVALGYAPWVEEVWANYISNGIKYGGLPAELHLGAQPTGDGKIKFWVLDNGPGISAAEQDRLFIPFSKLSQVQTSGHGLGLSIVRRIIEKLNGTVGVESPGPNGSGSLFYFCLPAAN